MPEQLVAILPHLIAGVAVALLLPPLLWFVAKFVRLRLEEWIQRTTDTVYFGDPELEAAVCREIEREAAMRFRDR